MINRLPAHEIPDSPTVEQIIALRHERFTGREIARRTGVSPATVSRILRAAKLSRVKDLEPAAPVVRYERQTPGELIHLDIKKLGRFEAVGHRITGDRTKQSNRRGAGWEYVHVSIDDASRLAFSQVMPDETAASAVPFPDGNHRHLCQPRRHSLPRHDRQRLLL
jgi:transcriptional regulator with XRE-family HTH domain